MTKDNRSTYIKFSTMCDVCKLHLSPFQSTIYTFLNNIICWYLFAIVHLSPLCHPSIPSCHDALSHWTCLTFYKIFLFISVRVFDVHSINDIFKFPYHTPSTSNSLYVVPRLLVFSLTFNVLWEQQSNGGMKEVCSPLKVIKFFFT